MSLLQRASERPLEALRDVPVAARLGEELGDDLLGVGGVPLAREPDRRTTAVLLTYLEFGASHSHAHHVPEADALAVPDLRYPPESRAMRRGTAGRIGRCEGL